MAELARNIDNEYQSGPMPPGVLEETVSRYNSFVDLGSDPDFGKPTPMHKIQTPPFYAAWTTPILHDCRERNSPAGLSIRTAISLWRFPIPCSSLVNLDIGRMECDPKCTNLSVISIGRRS